MAALAVWNWPVLVLKGQRFDEIRSLFLISPILPYAFFLFSALLGWRYNNAGLVFISFSLAIAYDAIISYESYLTRQAFSSSISGHEAIAFFLPLNIVLFSLFSKRRLFSLLGLLGIGILLLQLFAVALLCQLPNEGLFKLLHYGKISFTPLDRFASVVSSQLAISYRDYAVPSLKGVSLPLLLAYTVAYLLLILQFLHTRDGIQSGYAAALSAAFIGFCLMKVAPAPMIFFIFAGIILIVVTLESSFAKTYIDELTGLNGRRKLNEALINLGNRYAIAMIDVDRFKRFNDKFGHRTGDQVLKMIAAKLEAISGGAKAYRYGGEEFTAVFPGKTAEDARPHLEQLRRAIETTPFIVRSKQRRSNKSPQSGRRKKKLGKQVKVTVSVGVASPNGESNSPEKVLKAADKLLYKAKRAGRNRIAN